MSSGPSSNETARRLSELRRAHPADATLQNLLSMVGTKLDTCARLPVFEYEASAEGHTVVAEVFRELAASERESFNDLLLCLRRHLDERDHRAVASPAMTEEPRQ